MISPVHFLYVLAVVAIIALIVNFKFKLPKKLFTAIIVMTVVTVCWIAMEGDGNKLETAKVSGNVVRKNPLVPNGVINPGLNDIAFPKDLKSLSGSTRCYFLEASLPQGAMKNPNTYEASLHFSNGASLPCSGFYFSVHGLKLIFSIPENLSSENISFLRISFKGDTPLKFSKIYEEEIHN